MSIKKHAFTKGLPLMLMAAHFMASPAHLWAQDLGLEGDDAFTYDQLDIDGQYNKKRPSAADRVADYRRRLEEKNEDMVRQRIEKERIEQEQKLGKQLKGIFNGVGGQDEVSSKAAATTSVAEVKEEKSKKFETSKAKIIPSIGLNTLQGKDFDYESSLMGGVSAESHVIDQVAVGLGFTYTNVDIIDVSNNYYSTYYAPFPVMGREMNYRHYGVDIYSKYFPAPYSRVSPFVGLGLGYNRSSLKYTDSLNAVQFPQYQREVQYTSGFFSGLVTGGTEIRFTDKIGAAVEFKYRKAFNATQNNVGADFIQNVNGDQIFLNQLGQEIDDAHSMSLGAGVVIYF